MGTTSAPVPAEMLRAATGSCLGTRCRPRTRGDAPEAHWRSRVGHRRGDEVGLRLAQRAHDVGRPARAVLEDDPLTVTAQVAGPDVAGHVRAVRHDESFPKAADRIPRLGHARAGSRFCG